MTDRARLSAGALLTGGLVAIAGLAWHHMAILGDGFWTVATGRWLLAHHALPRSDPFAFASTGDWKIVSSGACLLFAAVADAMGPRGLMAFATAVEALAVWLLWSRSARTPLARLVLLPLALFYLQVDAEDLSARGQVFGDLGLVLLLGVLGRIRDGKRVHPALVFLLAAAWTNLHLSFLAATFLPAIAAALALLEPTTRPRARAFAIVAATAALAAFVNPFGPAYLRLALGTAFDSSTTQLDLFQSPNFHEPAWLVAPAIALGMLVLLARRASPTKMLDGAFLLLFVAAACKSRRFATGLVAVEIALAGPLLDAAWKARPRLVALGGAAISALLGAGLFLADGWARKDPFRDVPVAGALVARDAHRSAVATEQPFSAVVAPLHWGGYLAYEWMGAPRYMIDGRDHLELFGNGAFDDANALWRGGADALAILDVYEAGVVLWERGQPLDAILRQHPGWRLVHESEMDVVYIRAVR